MLGGERRHGCQNRPGARRPDERQRRSEHDARPEAVTAARSAARARGEWLEEPARPLGEERREQHETDEGEQEHGDRVQDVLRQPERVEHARGGEREGDEREREPDGDAEGRRRPPVVDVARTTGMIGSTHGERKVATPATRAARN